MTQIDDKSRSQKRKTRIGVIFGGRSGEHEVSIMSAQSVMSALDPDKYDVVMIGITKEGHWLTGEVTRALVTGDIKAASSATLLPEPRSATLMEIRDPDSEASRLTSVAEIDVIFPVLHGPYGEDGTVQGLLELADVPYVGAGVVGSAVGMDKAIFKAVMIAHSLPILPWVLVRNSDWETKQSKVIENIEGTLNYPVFTKPANLGSSVGISKCLDRTDLEVGILKAARYDRRVIVEQGIKARELEVSVLGNENPVASVIGEIRPKRDFYDYVAKYVSDDSELLIPADLNSDMSGAIRAMAVKAFVAMDCAGMGRVDFLLDTESNLVYINEVNTIPGFTKISMYPKLWEASGLPYSKLLDRLIELAIERFEEKQKIETAFQVELDE